MCKSCLGSHELPSSLQEEMLYFSGTTAQQGLSLKSQANLCPASAVCHQSVLTPPQSSGVGEPSILRLLLSPYSALARQLHCSLWSCPWDQRAHLGHATLVDSWVYPFPLIPHPHPASVASGVGTERRGEASCVSPSCVLGQHHSGLN